MPKKMIFDLQLADLPVQKIKLPLAGSPLRRRTAALEDARRAVQQLLLPVVDPVRMNAELTRQLGDRPAPPTAATTTPSLLIAALCFFRVRFISGSCAVALSRGRAPP